MVISDYYHHHHSLYHNDYCFIGGFFNAFELINFFSKIKYIGRYREHSESKNILELMIKKWKSSSRLVDDDRSMVEVVFEYLSSVVPILFDHLLIILSRAFSLCLIRLTIMFLTMNIEFQE